jgi:plasmid stabilization system protein ParE
MNFSVDWLPEAEDQLTALWTAASDRAAVTAAARRIDQMLGHDPSNAGESRDRSERLLFVPPLGVLFRIDEPARLVRVTSVGWSGRPV